MQHRPSLTKRYFVSFHPGNDESSVSQFQANDIFRDCAWLSLPDSGCFSAEDTGRTFEVSAADGNFTDFFDVSTFCYCRTDGCNGADPIKASRWQLPLVVVSAAALKITQIA